MVQNHYINQDFPFKEDDKTWTCPHKMIDVKHRLLEDSDGSMPTFKFNSICCNFYLIILEENWAPNHCIFYSDTDLLLFFNFFFITVESCLSYWNCQWKDNNNNYYNNNVFFKKKRKVVCQSCVYFWERKKGCYLKPYFTSILPVSGRTFSCCRDPSH